MKEKLLDIAHYFANAIVSDPSILKDDTYLLSIPDRIGISGKERDAFKGLINAAVKSAAPLTVLSADTFSQALQQSRSKYAPDLGSAMKWAMQNADMMRRYDDRRISTSRQEAADDYSEDSALDVFLA